MIDFGLDKEKIFLTYCGIQRFYVTPEIFTDFCNTFYFYLFNIFLLSAAVMEINCSAYPYRQYFTFLRQYLIHLQLCVIIVSGIEIPDILPASDGSKK